MVHRAGPVVRRKERAGGGRTRGEEGGVRPECREESPLLLRCYPLQSLWLLLNKNGSQKILTPLYTAIQTAAD